MRKTKLLSRNMQKSKRFVESLTISFVMFLSPDTPSENVDGNKFTTTFLEPQGIAGERESLRFLNGRPESRRKSASM